MFQSVVYCANMGFHTPKIIIILCVLESNREMTQRLDTSLFMYETQQVVENYRTMLSAREGLRLLYISG